MHDLNGITKSEMAGTPDRPMRRWVEKPRVASSETPSADMPGHSGGTAEPADSGNEKGCLRPQAPERIYGWLDSQMSIARFYGGLSYMGHSYTIAGNERGAPLVRDDVLKRELKAKDEADKAARTEDRRRASDAQGVML